MQFEAIGAHATEDDVRLVNDALWAAQAQYEAVKRLVRAPIAKALFEPPSPAVHAAGLAAYAMWLSELHGDFDRDWLRL
jgi:hypothetical protein